LVVLRSPINGIILKHRSFPNCLKQAGGALVSDLFGTAPDRCGRHAFIGSDPSSVTGTTSSAPPGGDLVVNFSIPGWHRISRKAEKLPKLTNKLLPR
jgi:hypothetical protein